MPKEKFAALADYTTNPLFSDLERSVIRYAEEMTEKVQVDAARFGAGRGPHGSSGSYLFSL